MSKLALSGFLRDPTWLARALEHRVVMQLHAGVVVHPDGIRLHSRSPGLRLILRGQEVAIPHLCDACEHARMHMRMHMKTAGHGGLRGATGAYGGPRGPTADHQLRMSDPAEHIPERKKTC